MIKVMIVDDSMIIRMSLKKLFEKHRFEVIAEVSNGQDAVDKYLELKPDLVTMDITMPGLDGISALEQICERDSDANIIMISALGQEIKIIESLNKGAKHYITKPFEETDVMSKVDDVFGCVL